MLETLVTIGHTILVYMSQIFDTFFTKLGDLLPWDLSSLTTAVPILDTVLSYTLFDIMIGPGLIILIGYAVIKWLIP